MSDFRLLVVCTGNICRSPAAARLLSHTLVPSTGFLVESAGTSAMVGWPIDDGIVPLLDELDIASYGHVARQVNARMLERSDLVLTATRAHRSRVVELARSVLPRAFTLTEFAALLSTPDARAVAPTDDAVARARALTSWAATNRPALMALPPDSAPDVIDPFGRNRSTYRRAFEQVRGATDAIGDAIRGED